MAPAQSIPLSPGEIRALRAAHPKARTRDLAHAHGLTEAELIAAHVGHGAVAIDPTPDRLFPLIRDLGDVMALTRNASCVHERRGVYSDYRSGTHAAMVLDPEIDLRIFPSHWIHGFAVVDQGEDGPKRSLQIFDAAGDAVHKVHLKPASDVAAFDRLAVTLGLPDQLQSLTLIPRAAPESPKGNPARADDLRRDWDAMTDTHQFNTLTRRLKMNRLGAYLLAGETRAARIAPDSITRALHAAADGGIPLMIFVGNQGCIQIHGGPVSRIVPMGPWINVMDPRFNLHLRSDHIAQVWRVTKPTRTGPAISLEAFDHEGQLILQVFGYRKDAAPRAWNSFTATLPALEEVSA